MKKAKKTFSEILENRPLLPPGQYDFWTTSRFHFLKACRIIYNRFYLLATNYMHYVRNSSFCHIRGKYVFLMILLFSGSLTKNADSSTVPPFTLPNGFAVCRPISAHLSGKSQPSCHFHQPAVDTDQQE
nr:unnamed protein product [Callosobruchus chinensis]